MKQTLSAKEILFCTYYALNRCAREAAAKSGYRFPERSAMRLLQRDEINAYIARIDRERAHGCEDVIAGYARLAFGCVSDAVRLLLREDWDEAALDGLDLFLVSDIKRPKGGGLEIKFFDRLKALEHLEALVCQKAGDEAESLFDAIRQGAEAIKRSEHGT